MYRNLPDPNWLDSLNLIKSSCARGSALRFLFPFPWDFNCFRFDMRKQMWFQNVVLIAVFSKMTSETSQISSKSLWFVFGTARSSYWQKKSCKVHIQFWWRNFVQFPSFCTDFCQPAVKNFYIPFSFLLRCFCFCCFLRILTSLAPILAGNEILPQNFRRLHYYLH